MGRIVGTGTVVGREEWELCIGGLVCEDTSGDAHPVIGVGPCEAKNGGMLSVR